MRRNATVLLVQQRGPDDPVASWSLPGEVVEDGEVLAETLAREVREETGLTMRWFDPAFTSIHWVDIYFYLHTMVGGPVQAMRQSMMEINMNALEMLQTAEFVVDAHRNKKAVVLDYKIWEELLALLEDWEDAEELHRLRKTGEEAIPWEQAKAELRTEGITVQPIAYR